MKVLVTGSNGYIGRNVVKELLALGHTVIATDISDGIFSDNVKFVCKDIFAECETLFEELYQPDVLIHLAWRDGFLHNSEAHLKYLYDHYKFLISMVNKGVKQVVVMGSMHEVGYFEGAIDENTPTNPKSLYGIAKNSLRQTLEVALKDRNVIFQWIRGFYIYGDDLKSNSIFGKILLADSQGKKTFPFTSGKNKYDFITCEELGFQIAKVASQTEIDGIINCCSGKPVSLADQVENFIKNNNLLIKLEYGAFPDRLYDSPAIWGNSDKIEEILKK